MNHSKSNPFTIIRWSIGLLFLLATIYIIVTQITTSKVLIFTLILFLLGWLILPPTLPILKKNKWVLTVIIFSLILLNPSTSEFKDSVKELSDNPLTIYKRKYNCIFFSIYVKEWGLKESNRDIFIGIVGNFFKWR